MQVNTLACDFCKGVRPAVATVRLVVDGRASKLGQGRHDDPKLDLCRPHLNEVVQAFTPKRRSRFGTRMGMRQEVPRIGSDTVDKKRAKDNANYAKKKAKGKAYVGKPERRTRRLSKEALAAARARAEAHWQPLIDRALDLIPGGTGTIGASPLRAHLGLEQSAFSHLMRQMQERGLVRKESNARWTRYGRVGGHDATAAEG